MSCQLVSLSFGWVGLGLVARPSLCWLWLHHGQRCVTLEGGPVLCRGRADRKSEVRHYFYFLGTAVKPAYENKQTLSNRRLRISSGVETAKGMVGSSLIYAPLSMWTMQEACSIIHCQLSILMDKFHNLLGCTSSAHRKCAENNSSLFQYV